MKDYENVNIDVFLVFDYAIRNDWHPTINTIRAYNVDMIFSKEYTRIIYRFEISDVEKDSTRESIKAENKIYVTKNTFLEKGILRLSLSNLNYANFKKENVKIYSTSLNSPFDDPEYVQLDRMEEQTRNCSGIEECYSIGKLKMEDNKFIIILQFDNIFYDRESIIDYLKSIIKYKKNISIFLRGSLQDITRANYQVNILIPENCTLIYNDFSAKQEPHYYYLYSDMNTLIMNIEKPIISGNIKITYFNIDRLLTISAFSLAILSFAINIIMKIYGLIPRNRENGSRRNQNDDDSDLNIEPNYCE